MVFHWILSDSKDPQVSKTLLSILADLNNAVALMVSTRPLISKSSSPCTNPLVTLPHALITISIIVTFMFHSFFSSLARSLNLSLFSPSFGFTKLSAERQSWLIGRVSFFVWNITRSGRLAAYSPRIFHTNAGWWSFTYIRMTGSLLMSPGLFSVFWLILVMLQFGSSQLVLQFPTLLISLSSLWEPVQAQYNIFSSLAKSQ